MMQANLLMWQALTPVHSGTGQSSSGVIDLPVAREVATNYPVLPASSIKGVLRAGQDDETHRQLFGSLEAAGSLSFTDARLLCLPVRSYRGTFAYVTCALVLNRLAHDLGALGHSLTLPGRPVVPEGSAHVSGEALKQGGAVLLEDVDLTAVDCPAARATADLLAGLTGLGDELTARFAIVADDVFSFLAETAMEVTAHTRLDPHTKTVMNGALWYEESLPAGSLLSSFLLRGSSAAFTLPDWVQVGGKGSVGRGLLSVKEVRQ